MKDKLTFFGILVLVVALILFGIMECTSTRTFTGRLDTKFTETWYTHDERELVTEMDAEGKVSTHWRGDDETVAHIKYILSFYSEGKIRSVSVGHFSARVGYRHAESMAMNRLMANHSIPPLYTHTKVGQEYLVDVRGWLMDGAVRDITLLSLVPAEK